LQQLSNTPIFATKSTVLHHQTIIFFMDNYRTLLSSEALCGVVGLSGCTLSQMVKLAKEQQLTTVPAPLEAHGDSVKFDMSAALPVKMLKKGTTYTGKVDYKYGEKRVEVGTIELKADNFPNASKEQPKVSKTFSFPYAEDMADQKGNLLLTGTASKGGKSKQTPEFPFTPGVISTSRLVKDIYLSSYAEHGYNNQPEYEPVNVNFYFQQGKADLRASETRSQRGKYLDAFIAEKNETKTVTVTGSHSPEGTEAKNTKVSGQRSGTVEKYYRGQMKKYDYKEEAEKIEFVQKAVVLDETWSMFKDSLSTNKQLTEDQKSQILAVVDGSDSFYDKAGKLASFPFYRKLLGNVYPKLRTAQTEILKLKEKKSDAEISVLAKQIAESRTDTGKLEENELLYAASMTPVLEEKKAIYEAAVKKSDSWQAHNNLGAVQLEIAKKAIDSQMSTLVDEAIGHFKMANTKQESAEAYSNLAVAQMMKGDRKAAEEALNKAASMNGSQEVARAVNASKGVNAIRKGNYSDAINALNNAGQDAMVLYNKGLAQLLNKQPDVAMATLNESATANNTNGLTYYVMAVAAARAKNEQAIYTNLQKAVQLDSNLKGRAIKDLEFEPYANSSNFKSAVQ
jgi:hypothetical protein